MSILFQRPVYHHLNKILVSRSALEHNHAALKAKHPEAQIAPVLKSNAYGHGLKVVAPVFNSFGAPFLCVDSLYEAYQLHSLRLKTPILVMGYTHPDNYQVKRLPFQFTVFDLESARALNQSQRDCQIHLFVDTGMRREGIPLGDLSSFLVEIKKLSNLKVIGLMSHLADADNPDDNSFSQEQIGHYKEALRILASCGIEPRWRHLSASAGAIKFNDPIFNLLRPGLASYGINPLVKFDRKFGAVDLQPALTFFTTLVQIKMIAKGDRVGYNGTFVAPRNMKIGILPAGYYDGIDRRLSNLGTVKVKDQQCRILGRVSMNITTVDLSDVEAEVGDPVELISANPQAKNSLAELAKKANTIPYELLVHLAESLKREIVV